MFDADRRDEAFWRWVRGAFDKWWHDYKNAKGTWVPGGRIP